MTQVANVTKTIPSTRRSSISSMSLLSSFGSPSVSPMINTWSPALAAELAPLSIWLAYGPLAT